MLTCKQTSSIIASGPTQNNHEEVFQMAEQDALYAHDDLSTSTLKRSGETKERPKHKLDSPVTQNERGNFLYIREGLKPPSAEDFRH